MNNPQKPYPYPQPELAGHSSPAPQAPNPAPPLKVLPPPDSQSPATGQQALSGGEGELATANPQTPQIDAASQPKKRRRTGKIARLKKVDRDRLNQMLRDGDPYADILEKLGEPAKGITVQNVSDWFKGGYKEWESDQEWVEESQAEMEVALDVGMECDARKVNQSVIQIAVLKVFQGLRKMGLDTMDEKRLTDPVVFARVANALARLSKEGLNLQKHGEAAAKAVATELKRLDPNRELTEREDEIITDRMDDYFLKSRRRKPDPASTTPPTPPPSPLAAASLKPAVAHAQEPERHPTQPSVPPATPVNTPTPAPATAPLASPPSPAGRPGGSPVHSHGPSKPSVAVPNSTVPPTRPDGNPLEHCLACGAELPALLPNGREPSHYCKCGQSLSLPGLNLREHCPQCAAAQPVHGYNTQRLSETCPTCGATLPPLDPKAFAPWISPNARSTIRQPGNR